MIRARLARVELGDGLPVRIMGVVNVSPESFYKGSVRVGYANIAEAAVKLAEEGADVIDVGARSTAPYLSTAIPIEEEKRRMVEAVKAVKDHVDIPVSADTTSSAVAEEALKAGAEIINDVAGLKGDPAMARVVADHRASVIVSAREARPAKGRPVQRIVAALQESLRIANLAGVDEEQVVVDPAVGFFRYPDYPWYLWDCEVIARLAEVRREVKRPVCVGVSRKSFIGALLGYEKPEERLYGSLSATAIAVFNGVDLVRTHDVAATRDAVRIAEALRKTLASKGPHPAEL
ncbi:MAG: dihydropteroate synthase [Candidatus Nezhaarchaeota archaeon]|nr:dihydropteroate synthase [Candidatus Nezhaarchaeota archaeon]